MFKTFLFFDYLYNDLANEFEERYNNHKHFTEEEIYALVSSTISGLNFLHSQNLTHGSLRLRNVYLNSSNSFKLADPSLFNLQSDYQKIYKDKSYGQFVLLAPELLHALDRRIEKPQVDWSKCDVFSLGMILL